MPNIEAQNSLRQPRVVFQLSLNPLDSCKEAVFFVTASNWKVNSILAWQSACHCSCFVYGEFRILSKLVKNPMVILVLQELCEHLQVLIRISVVFNVELFLLLQRSGQLEVHRSDVLNCRATLTGRETTFGEGAPIGP